MDSYQFYVPAQFVPMIRIAALRWHGGYTETPGSKGAWMDKHGATHYDDITIMEIFSDTASVVDTVSEYLFQNGELAVAYKVNGVPYIVNNSEDK